MSKLIFIYLFTGLSGLPINRILCLIFFVEKNYISYRQYKNTWKKKKTSIQIYNDLSPKKVYEIYYIVIHVNYC